VTCNNPFGLRWKFPNRWVPAFIFLLGVLLLLPSVWSETSVTGMDEYSLSFRTPMEMRDRGEWLTPWLNGEPRLRKTPLIYWAILLNYKLFGVHLLSARIWGVFSGAGLAVCACLFSRELFKRDGLLAGLLALATMGVAVEGRRAMLDLPSALFSTLAVLCFVKWLKAAQENPSRLQETRDQTNRLTPHPGPLPVEGRGRTTSAVQVVTTAPAEQQTGGAPLVKIILSALLLGLSFLTKGPVGFLFFIAGALACVVVFRRQRLFARCWWQILLGLIVLAAVCLPWPLLMQHLWPGRFGQTMDEELAARQFGHWTPGSPLSAWSGALGLVLPWTPLMLAAIYSLFRNPNPNRLRENRFLIGWFLLSAIPFFFMRSFERYMLALIPAQVVLCAEWLENNQTRTREIILRICVLVLAAVAVAFCLFAWWFHLAVWGASAALLLAGFTVFRAFRQTHPHWLAFASALLFTLVLGGIYPRFGINALPENLQTELASSPVTLFDPPQPSLLSMRLGRSLQAFDAKRTREHPGLASTSEVVLVDSAHRQNFFELMQKHQLHAEEKGHFRTFYSRRAWIRFARPDARWEDWKVAFRARSLEDLKSEFRYYLVTSDRS